MMKYSNVVVAGGGVWAARLLFRQRIADSMSPSG